MKRTVFTLLFLIALAPMAEAQETPVLEGREIERIEVVGNRLVATDTIRVYLGVYPGDQYVPSTIRENFSSLWQTGLFDDIWVEAVEGDSGGVVLRVHVEERPRVSAVEFRGNDTLKASDLNEALEREEIDIHIGTPVEQRILQRAAEAIRRAYSETGHETVDVDMKLEETQVPGERRVVFEIDEGLKARVAQIYFEGNTEFSRLDLLTTMKEVKRHNLVTWVRKKNIYTPSKLQEDLERIRELYQDEGYQDVSFGEPRIEQTGKYVNITIPIKEGPVHYFSDVSVDGMEVFESERLIGNFPLEDGDVLRRNAIQNRIELIEELYRRRGYIYAFVDPEYREVEENVVDLHLNVYEGEQFRLGRLEFVGNEVTKDKVLRREIYLHEGDVMDMETFRLSLYKLGQLGYFKLTQDPEFEVNPEEQTVDITVKGKEEGKNDIQFGGGYSERYGFFAQFQFSTRNFLGEGESLGVSFQQGDQQNFFSLSYADPWFLDRPQSLGISIFKRDTQLPRSLGFESDSTGGSLAYGFRLDRFESVRFLYGYEEREENVTIQSQPDREGNVPLARIRDTQFTTSAFVPSYSYDSRDNPFDTTRGTKASLALSYTGGPLGGTINMVKPIVNLSRFHPLTSRSVLSFNLEAGQIFPQDDDDCVHFFQELDEQNRQICIPRSERFFLGGEQSMRG
ncbi:MAG: outer membrane protein assembly factor BamA, partial [Thermoanaerobaculia bacterium]|nr:outer membrane protein assembly factor BamA [Thermoanaerobaculia bacterium]